MEYYDKNGQFNGISIDYLRKISDLLGVEIEIEFASGNDWPGGEDMLRQRKIDMVSMLVQRPKNKSFATFTNTFLSIPSELFTHENSPFITNLEELHGSKLAATRNSSIEAFLKQNYPRLTLITTEAENTEDALEMVRNEEVSACAGNIMATGHSIRNNRIYRFENRR